MIKIAVTGASGFIGTELIKYLSSKKNCKILAIYNKTKPKIIKKNTIEYKKVNLKYKYKNFFKLLDSPDILIHLAWSNLDNYKSKSHLSITEPFHYYFLNNIIKNGLKNLFCAGTCFEYGKIEGALFENMKTKPDNNYGKSKVLLLQKIIKLKKNYNFNLVWGRFFYIYGKTQKNTIYSQLLKSINNKAKIFKMSKGLQKRDYLPISKLIEYIFLLSFYQKDFGIVNICSGKPIYLKSLVKKWIKELDSKITIDYNFYPYNDYEAMEFWGSNNKLKKSIRSLKIKKNI